MNRASILSAASDAVTRDRANTYGPAEDSFALIAGHWTWWLQDKLQPGAVVEPYDVAQMMVGLKQARIKANPGHADSWVDGCGYLACGGEIAIEAAAQLIGDA